MYFMILIKKISLYKTWCLAFGLAIVAVGLVILLVSAEFKEDYYQNSCPASGVTQSGERIQIRRIASTALASDEILVALLQEAGVSERLIAASYLVDNPDYSDLGAKLPHSVMRIGDNLENLSTIKADLVVFTSFNRPAVSKTLAQTSARTCFLEKFASLTDIRFNILALGQATGLVAASEAIARRFDERIAKETLITSILNEQDANQTQPGGMVSRFLSYDGSGTVMAGQTTFDDVVRLAGGINIASEVGLTGWPTINPEALAQMAPEVIVLIPGQQTAQQLIANLEKSPGWQETPAVKNNRYVIANKTKIFALGPSILDVVPELRTGFVNLKNSAMGDQAQGRPKQQSKSDAD